MVEVDGAVSGVVFKEDRKLAEILGEIKRILEDLVNGNERIGVGDRVKILVNCIFIEGSVVGVVEATEGIGESDSLVFDQMVILGKGTIVI